MVYLWIFLGLFLACVLLGVANMILNRVKRKRSQSNEKKGVKD